MKINCLLISTLFSVAFITCKNLDQKSETVPDTIFPKGEKITNDNFNGNTFLQPLVDPDSLFNAQIGDVSFDAGGRMNWHSHPGGQILLVIGGVGYYQEKGSVKRMLHKGDVVKCPPNLAHWHGASRDTGFVQVAITPRAQGATVWLEPVTDADYNDSKYLQ